LLITCETVAIETPASLLMSFIVTILDTPHFNRLREYFYILYGTSNNVNIILSVCN